MVDGAALAADRARIEADRAGRATIAPSLTVVRRSMEFRGHGDVTLDPVTFDVPFLAEPTFTSGVAMLVRPAAAEWRMPQATALLESWTLNSKGFYVGARLSAAVFMQPQPNVQPVYPAWTSLVFHLQFTGLGLASEADGENVTVRQSRV